MPFTSTGTVMRNVGSALVGVTFILAFTNGAAAVPRVPTLDAFQAPGKLSRIVAQRCCCDRLAEIRRPRPPIPAWGCGLGALHWKDIHYSARDKGWYIGDGPYPRWILPDGTVTGPIPHGDGGP
jgi:hypothetical protein